jgi:two-component system alkaline phosphatase synthesis response regulator PhoP
MDRKKILVVDDEIDIVRAMTIRLRNAGYEVISAQDGVAATKMALRECPDLILMDIGMPCGDGHIVAERLFENMATATTPIVFLTARTSETDRGKAAKVGAAAYITKPFNSEDLLKIVSQTLAGEKKLSVYDLDEFAN